MFSDLRARVLDCWNIWGMDGKKPSELSFIRRSSTWQGQAGKQVYYIFRKGARQPVLIAKTVQNASYGESIRREAQNAFMVWKQLAMLAPSMMPHPIALDEIADLPVYFEDAVPGLTLSDLGWRVWTDTGRRKLLCGAFSESLTWLQRFTQAMPSNQVLLDEEKIQSWFLDPICQFRPLSTSWPGGQERLNRLEHTVLDWSGCKLPLVAAHGDFWGGSLMWGESGLRAIDWEFFKSIALPTLDAFMLVTHPGFCIGIRGCYLLGEFRTTLVSSQLSGIVHEQLRTYMDLWNIPREWFSSILSLFFIDCSLERDGLLVDTREGQWADLLRYYWEEYGE